MPVGSPNRSLTSECQSSATAFRGNRTSVLALFRKIRLFFTPPLQPILSSVFRFTYYQTTPVPLPDNRAGASCGLTIIRSFLPPTVFAPHSSI